MSTSALPKIPAAPKPAFGFNPRPRRRLRPTPTDGRSNEELVAEFLKTRQPTVCDPMYADGSVKSSGAYDF